MRGGGRVGNVGNVGPVAEVADVPDVADVKVIPGGRVMYGNGVAL